jgi:hypothetical protein
VHRVEAIGPLPRNVEWLHHGAVFGRDGFREVSRIVVVGRPAPSPSAVQACAEALTGAACTRLPARQWYQRIAPRRSSTGCFGVSRNTQHDDQWISVTANYVLHMLNSGNPHSRDYGPPGCTGRPSRSFTSSAVLTRHQRLRLNSVEYMRGLWIRPVRLQQSGRGWPFGRKQKPGLC